jgi:hypothetical protein
VVTSTSAPGSAVSQLARARRIPSQHIATLVDVANVRLGDSIDERPLFFAVIVRHTAENRPAVYVVRELLIGPEQVSTRFSDPDRNRASDISSDRFALSPIIVSRTPSAILSNVPISSAAALNSIRCVTSTVPALNQFRQR